MRHFTLLVLVGAALAVLSTGALAAGRLDGRRAPAPVGAELVTAMPATAAPEPCGAAATTIAGSRRDGAACSSSDECKSEVCEGGSCCTDHGATCDSSSHCCGHQSCKADGTCP